jgi:hypothetical protein
MELGGYVDPESADASSTCKKERKKKKSYSVSY